MGLNASYEQKYNDGKRRSLRTSWRASKREANIIATNGDGQSTTVTIISSGPSN